MLVKTLVTQRSPCYSAVSALLTILCRIVLNIRHFATPTTSILINTPLVSTGQTLYQAAPLETNTILLSSLLQNLVGNSEKRSALRKLNNKQRQVSMFLILLLKLLTQFPFVSFLSISILSLLPFSILSLVPLPHPFFLF